MKVPIRNLYYLLSYVWDVDWEMEWSSISAEKSADALNLLAKILTISTDRLIRRGLDRGYKSVSEEVFGLRGRIDISSTIKRNGFAKSKLTCNFDELSYSVLHNQILKSTLENLVKTNGLDKELREEIHDLLHRMSSIDSIRLQPNVFASVRFHSNIRSYRLPISVCRLIYDQLLPNPASGQNEFVDLTDEKLFRIFEKFIYNFYSKHVGSLGFNGVKKERLEWQDTILLAGGDDLLPTMETDVCLIGDLSRLVIECKFYKSALQSRFGDGDDFKGSFISSHIYQLYAYLKNLQIKDGKKTSGLIFYPENGKKIDAAYQIHGHKVGIKTIDLAMSPQDIHSWLINEVKSFDLLTANSCATT